MFSVSEQIIPYFITLVLVSFYASHLLYSAILKSNKNKWAFLYIPAEKSPTNARLLGGLGTALSILISFSFMLIINSITPFLQTNDLLILKVAIPSVILLTLSGYIDDRYELRARYKLFFQFLSVGTFAFISTQIYAHNHAWLVFTISIFVGFALINGANLLDGLDSMSIKIGSVISFGFLFLAYKTGSATLSSLSVATLASLGSFYFFGREPAKIYMGEIGGSLLGFLYYVQAIIAYGELNKYGNGYESASWVIIVCALPVFELAISFARRIIMGKSPFRGDKLHLHHILKLNYKLSATTTSDLISGTLFLISTTGFLFSAFASPILGALIVLSLLLGTYLKICLHDWMKIQNSFNQKNLFLLFEDKPVYVVNSDLFKAVSLNMPVSSDSLTKKKKQAA